MAGNGITDPAHPGFVPYYERRGTAAEGVAAEWLRQRNRAEAEVLAKYSPRDRDALRRMSQASVIGEFQNLERFEQREVRRGRVAELEDILSRQGTDITASILLQHRSIRDGVDTTLADAEKTYADAVRDLPDGDAGRKEAEGWLAKERQEAAADYSARLGELVTQTHAKILMAEPLIDAAVSDGLLSPQEGRARKRTAARAAYASVFKTLVAERQTEAASAFVAALEPQPVMNADGTVVTDGNGLPEVADSVAARLYGFTTDEVLDMRKMLEQTVKMKEREAHAAAVEAERAAVGEIDNLSANALARGGIDTIDAAREEIEARAKLMPKGSRLETVALQQAKRLDKAAQAEADRLTWDAIVDSAANGTKWTPPEGSRQARNYKALKASFDRQAEAYAAEGILAQDAAVQEERKANEAALKAAMLASAGVEPGAFMARLAEAAEKGHITLGQYRRLRDEFRDVWTKEGMPKKAKALVDILKNEFYAGAAYDLNDRLAVNPKTGKFEYAKNPDTKKPFEGEDVEFKAQVFVPHDPNSWGGLKDFIGINRAAHYETKTLSLTSDEQLKMLDWAMELARHDGEWISTDPQTGARLDKPRKLDAAAEFQDACSRLRTMKQAQSSQDLLTERANAMLNLRAGFAQADDAVTGAAAKRAAAELKTRETLKSAKRKPFAPKMPGGRGGGLQPADEETED